MSYSDREDGYKGVTYGVGAMALLGLWFGVRMLAALGSASASETPASVEAKLLADPDGSKLFATIKRTYPDEFEGLKNTIVEHNRTGRPVGQVQDVVLNYLIAAGKRHRQDMIQAPHQPLADYRHAEIALVETLQRADPALCAQFVTEGSFYAPNNTSIAPNVLIDFRRVAWEADAAGRDHPVHRALTPLGPAVWRAIAVNMAEDGLSSAQVRTYFDPAAIRSTSPTEQCRIGVAFLRAIERLPDETGDNFYASLAARPT